MSPKILASVLLKAQIAHFLGADTRVSKVSLVEQLWQLIEQDECEYQRLLNTFPDELAVEPVELRQMLGCSGSERRRWLKEGKLPILRYRTFRAAGRELCYPVHDRRVILALTPEQIMHWRQEHYDQARQRRSEAARQARQARRLSSCCAYTVLARMGAYC